jgi:hypothetical protein
LLQLGAATTEAPMAEMAAANDTTRRKWSLIATPCSFQRHVSHICIAPATGTTSLGYLDKDREFLKAGGVFDDFIEMYTCAQQRRYLHRFPAATPT